MTGHVFLAYSDEDLNEVGSLYQRLKQDGFQLWMKAKDLLPGQTAATEVRNKIRDARVVLACVSSASVHGAGELQKQIRLALNKQAETPAEGISFIPVCLDRCQIPDHVFADVSVRFSDIHQADLFERDGYAKLVEALKLACPPTISPSESADGSPGSGGRLGDVIEAFELLHAASVEGAGRTNHPAIARIRENLSDCLDDLRCSPHRAERRKLAQKP
jgi:hypothetical protein